ncbi:hypothetical protein GW932_01465 [archaeon]|nr:hypothetical protein [archaeon]
MKKKIKLFKELAIISHSVATTNYFLILTILIFMVKVKGLELESKSFSNLFVGLISGIFLFSTLNKIFYSLYFNYINLFIQSRENLKNSKALEKFIFSNKIRVHLQLVFGIILLLFGTSFLINNYFVGIEYSLLIILEGLVLSFIVFFLIRFFKTKVKGISYPEEKIG